MKISFRVVPSSYHEKPSRRPPQGLVTEHAIGKAKLAKVSAEKGFVLGADTIVYCAGKILGKPKSMKAAYRMLALISGKAHEVYTGVALRNLQTGKSASGFSKTKVFIRKLSAGEIRGYCQKVPPLDKAGAYAIQMKPKIVSKIQGSYSNVVGLPKELVRELIKKVRRG